MGNIFDEIIYSILDKAPQSIKKWFNTEMNNYIEKKENYLSEMESKADDILSQKYTYGCNSEAVKKAQEIKNKIEFERQKMFSEDENVPSGEGIDINEIDAYFAENACFYKTFDDEDEDEDEDKF